MKRVSSDKYTIAWFKLSECIARGEKERALGMYRLLAHSLDNSAFAKQLEGDILLFFDDRQAHEKYHEAIKLYLGKQRFLEAAMIYEHLLSIGIEPTSDYYADLVEWYTAAHVYDKVKYYGLQWTMVLIHKQDWMQLEKNITRFSALFGLDVWVCQLRQRIIEAAIARHADSDRIMNFIAAFLNDLTAANDAHTMQFLLSHLRATHTEYYEKTCQYINEQC